MVLEILAKVKVLCGLGPKLLFGLVLEVLPHHDTNYSSGSHRQASSDNGSNGIAVRVGFIVGIIRGGLKSNGFGHLFFPFLGVSL